ncbi:MAG: hypothetical protein NVSMB21_23500 [Vulcanimicrobiaceae bacterium]
MRERGGGRLEAFVRLFSGNGGDSLYAALIDHGVAQDVARRLSAEILERGVVVIAGWTGDMTLAARVLVEAGGDVIRGADAGVIGTPRPRQPGPNGRIAASIGASRKKRSNEMRKASRSRPHRSRRYRPQ